MYNYAEINDDILLQRLHAWFPNSEKPIHE